MMKFADTEHEQRFQELAAVYGLGRGEQDATAAIFLLSSPILARRCSKYVKSEAIRFFELVEIIGSWSSSEKGLVKLAAALFNSSWKADVNEVFWNLDKNNTELALEALRIRWEQGDG